MTRRAFLTVVALLLVQTAVPADILHLQGGGTLEGEVTEKGDTYVIKRGDSVMKIPKDMVVRVEKKQAVYDVYREKLAQIDAKDPNAYYELGVWCDSQKLSSEADEAFHAALRLNPSHARSREKLGYKQIGGVWHFRCPKCKGKGQQQCLACVDKKSLQRPCPNEECKGGKISCEACEGRGSFECTRCGGRGDFFCNKCGGDGVITNYAWTGTTRLTCDLCKGKGRTDCATCKAGRVPCKTCGGRGNKPCPDCKGQGYTVVACENCNGAGKIECKLCKGRGLVAEGTTAPPDSAQPEIGTEPAEPQKKPEAPDQDLAETVLPALASVKAFGANKINTGLGFAVRGDGLIVTSADLVKFATGIIVTIADGKKCKAWVHQKHPVADFVILRAETGETNLPFLRTGDPGALKPGDKVAVLGKADAAADSVAWGTVRSLKAKGPIRYIHTTIPAAPGGSPLLNTKGEVVGIVTSSGDDTKLSSAISVSELTDMLILIE